VSETAPRTLGIVPKLFPRFKPPLSVNTHGNNTENHRFEHQTLRRTLGTLGIATEAHNRLVARCEPLPDSPLFRFESNHD